MSFHSPRSSAWTLLCAAFALLVVPLAGEWGHGAFHGQADGQAQAHGAPAEDQGHVECEAWKVSAHHGTHSDEQFERSEPSHHEHHGLCYGHSPLSGAESTGSSSAPAVPASVAAIESMSSAEGPAIQTPRPRGPPARV